MMTNTPKQCRERMLAKLLECDPVPKIYPILPIPENLAMVCVWQIDDDLCIGDHAEFSALAPGYREGNRVLYFTVTRELSDQILAR